MTELNVGVIGCGMLAQSMHLPHLNELDGTCLKWACDVNPAALAKVKAKFHPQEVTSDYRQVVDDSRTHAIVLATAQNLRLPIIEAAAKAGKAIYCEKPIANTLAEMEEVQRIVEDTKIVFCAGHNRRSAPAIQYARQMFLNQRHHPTHSPWRLDRNTALREPWPEEDQAFMIIRINDDARSWKPWAVDADVMKAGPMLFEMTHFIDLACWFLEGWPVSVLSVGHHRMNHVVTLTFEDGSICTILETGVGTFGYPKELYELYGQGSAVVIDHFVEVRTGGIEGVPLYREFPLKTDVYPQISNGGGIRDFYAKRRQAELEATAAHDPQVGVVRSPEVDKGHKAHLARFLDAVRGGGESPCPCSDSIRVTRIAFAAIESHQTGKTVML